MKKRVFNYVKDNPGSSVHDIAEALNEEEIQVLGVVNDLTKEGFLAMLPPVPLSKDNDCSCYYKVCKAEYKESVQDLKRKGCKTMKIDESYFQIKSLLEKVEKEGIDSFYETIKNWKHSNGSSMYSAFINDIIGCCPSADRWKYPRIRESFKLDIMSYGNHYLSFYDE